MENRPSFTKIVAAGILALAVVACSKDDNKYPDGGAPSDAFAGSWIYSGMLTPSCGAGISLDPFDLTGDTVMITRTDDTHIEILLGGTCTVRFTVTVNVATASAGQSCTFDLGGNLGQQSVAISSWTLTAGGGDNLASSVSGSVAICTASGTGTLTPVVDL